MNYEYICIIILIIFLVLLLMYLIKTTCVCNNYECENINYNKYDVIYNDIEYNYSDFDYYQTSTRKKITINDLIKKYGINIVTNDVKKFMNEREIYEYSEEYDFLINILKDKYDLMHETKNLSENTFINKFLQLKKYGSFKNEQKYKNYYLRSKSENNLTDIKNYDNELYHDKYKKKCGYI